MNTSTETQAEGGRFKKQPQMKRIDSDSEQARNIIASLGGSIEIETISESEQEKGFREPESHPEHLSITVIE